MRFKQYLTEDKYNIYVDMDGVLCDFLKSASKVTGYDIDDFQDWGKIRKNAWSMVADEGIKFWSNLNWNKGGKKLWTYIAKYNPSILSAHPIAHENKQYAIAGKSKWVSDHLWDVNKVHLVRGIDKQKFATPNSILIDDYKRNVKQWISKGGIGIVHTTTENTIKQLKEIGL